MREGDQGESSPIGRESDREGEIDNKGDKSEGKGTSDNDLTEREVYDTTLEGDGAKSKNDGVGSNSQSATKKRLRNQSTINLIKNVYYMHIMITCPLLRDGCKLITMLIVYLYG